MPISQYRMDGWWKPILERSEQRKETMMKTLKRNIAMIADQDFQDRSELRVMCLSSGYIVDVPSTPIFVTESRAAAIAFINRHLSWTDENYRNGEEGVEDPFTDGEQKESGT